MNRLSTRERDILYWTSHGKTAAETAEILHISRRTVEWHLRRLRTRTEAANITHLIAKAIKAGAVSITNSGLCGVAIAEAMVNTEVAQPIFNALFGNGLLLL